MTTGRINQVSIITKVSCGAGKCSLGKIMQYSVAVALLPFDRKAESSTTRHQHRIPKKKHLLAHTPSFPSSKFQCFPLGTFKQPALTSDQTPAQHGNSFLSPLFLSTILPDRDQIQQCLHALSHHGVFHWQFLHVFPTTCPEGTSQKPHKVSCQLSFPHQPN